MRELIHLAITVVEGVAFIMALLWQIFVSLVVVVGFFILIVWIIEFLVALF